MSLVASVWLALLLVANANKQTMAVMVSALANLQVTVLVCDTVVVD